MSVAGYNHQDTEDCLGVDNLNGQAAVFISQAYGCTEVKLSVDELKAFIELCQDVLAQLEPQPEPEEPKMYKSLAEAQEAMDRGETVRIEMDSSEINPALVQLAQDIQDREQLARWQRKLESGGQHRDHCD